MGDETPKTQLDGSNEKVGRRRQKIVNHSKVLSISKAGGVTEISEWQMLRKEYR